MSEEKSEQFNKNQRASNFLYKDFFKIYNVYSHEINKKVYIGEPNKKLRVCRFCNRSMKNGATFQKTAHAIPEALGNKYLILNEECDECNAKFGNTIEQHLIKFFDNFRVMNKVPGKKGIPKIKRDNLNVIEVKDEKLHITFTTRKMDDFGNLLESPIEAKVKPVKIYKALTKIALSVIDKELLRYFVKTIAWINGTEELINIKLPIVNILSPAEHIINPTLPHSEHPMVMVYIRKNGDYDLPFMVADFYFCKMHLVYIVPFCSEDKKSFTEEKDFLFFWKTFKPFSSIQNNWGLYDFSGHERTTYYHKIVNDPRNNCDLITMPIPR